MFVTYYKHSRRAKSELLTYSKGLEFGSTVFLKCKNYYSYFGAFTRAETASQLIGATF